MPENRQFALIRDHADQEVGTTASRRTRRSEFLRACTWAVEAGLHPRASPTTLRVAHDLAHRLNTDGHVAYSREPMWRRLRISRRTLERHVAVLREIGLLVWAEHGSRTNTRPAGSGEWAGTATIYAVVVPRAWDDAVGHRIRGRGYQARHVGFTERGRELAIADARRRARLHRRRDAPSRRTNHQRRTAQVEGKNNNTARRSGRQRPRQPVHVPEPFRANPQQAACAVSIAARIRPLVPWTQAEQLRRLAFALRPWISAGRSAEDIAAELMAWWVPGRPASPAALILARSRESASTDGPGEDHGLDDASPAITGVPPNLAFRKAVEQLRESLPRPAEPSGPEVPGFVIRDRILASLQQAERAWRGRSAQDCATFAEWETICDTREGTPW
ncbi:hypothetical protein [Actinacidiphila sp. ITFR-21]|uniref:hypothetical protein n=1 Tax=Actinacidiphila sp. ITFR-21 TaxID=3075199 RepID=UPI0028893938|nr:hypothetical protein [Streptomyces sp. ITFR-21]WNI20120.1 hypothetical protein RLT57_31775 [Streptomyces sp. ITFR-21]